MKRLASMGAVSAALVCLVVVAAAGGEGTAARAPSFSPGASLSVGAAPTAIAVGDFDSDGSPDVAVANAGDPSEPDGGYRSNVRILLNGGTGRFHMAPWSPFKADPFPRSIAVADFDGDGRLDLAVTGESLSILLGDGTGRFSEAPGSPVPFGGHAIKAADLNGDRIPDLVAEVDHDGGSSPRALLGDGSGRFTVVPAAPPVTAIEFISLDVADFNGDGEADLAVADGKTNRISILLGDGTGAFGAARRLSPGAKISGKVVTADFNGDGKPDLALPVRFGQTIAVLLGNGSGGFRAASSTSVTNGIDELAVADFDGDGKADLGASTDYAGTALMLGQGNGRFRPAPLSPFPVVADRLIAVGDFNGDTKTDILAVGGGIPEAPLSAPQNVVLFQTSSEPRLVQGRRFSARVDATFSTRSIRVLAADKNRAAVCARERLVVWTAPRGRSRNFRADCYYDLALGGGWVAWLQYFSWPTQPELTIRVYAHRLSGGPLVKLGRALNYAGHDDLSGGWLGQLLGAGPLLAFNHWDVDCLLPPGREDENAECENENPTLRISGQRLEILAAHSRRARRGSGFYPLRAVGGGRLAVAPAGAVVVLAANGARVAAVSAVDGDPPRGIALSRTRLAVLRTTALDVHNPASGAREASFPLGRAAALRLAGVNSQLALLHGPHALVLVRLRDGKLVSFPLGSAAAKHLVDAKLTAAGVFYAYNLRRRVKPGRLVFEPTARLLARF
jgi:FG-GAP-like repeat